MTYPTLARLVALTAFGLTLSACDQKDGGDDLGDVADGDTEGLDDPTGTAAAEPQPEPGTTTAGGEPPPADTGEPEAQEACVDEGTSRACIGDDVEGTQYCAPVGPEGALVWGRCLSYVECEPGQTEHCGFCPGGEGTGGLPEEECPGFADVCRLDGDMPTFGGEDSECNTPLVLSFDGGPVDIAPSPAATFDINANGGCLSTDWPAATTPWLALDLDRSGSIESGRELFGSGTRLDAGRRATNGFEALAALDDNDDGRIDGADARFADLVLWADADADKTATFAELTPVAARGLLSIDLGYHIDRRCDDRGNCEVERAKFTYVDRGGEVRTGEVVDIHLGCQ